MVQISQNPPKPPSLWHQNHFIPAPQTDPPTRDLPLLQRSSCAVAPVRRSPPERDHEMWTSSLMLSSPPPNRSCSQYISFTPAKPSSSAPSPRVLLIKKHTHSVASGSSTLLLDIYTDIFYTRLLHVQLLEPRVFLCCSHVVEP